MYRKWKIKVIVLLTNNSVKRTKTSYSSQFERSPTGQALGRHIWCFSRGLFDLLGNVKSMHLIGTIHNSKLLTSFMIALRETTLLFSFCFEVRS